MHICNSQYAYAFSEFSKNIVFVCRQMCLFNKFIAFRMRARNKIFNLYDDCRLYEYVECTRCIVVRSICSLAQRGKPLWRKNLCCQCK